MLNTLPDCDVPTEDDMINTPLIQVRSRKQETLRPSAQVHHHLSKKASLQHRLSADSTSLGAGAGPACRGPL